MPMFKKKTARLLQWLLILLKTIQIDEFHKILQFNTGVRSLPGKEDSKPGNVIYYVQEYKNPEV